MPEGIKVDERRVGRAMAQWIMHVRCDCGRRWFEAEAVDTATCPRCGLLVYVDIDTQVRRGLGHCGARRRRPRHPAKKTLKPQNVTPRPDGYPHVSRAFVKEMDGKAGDDLPELAVSPHRNLVTPSGLEHIESTLHDLETELAGARTADDAALVARIERDLRYFRQRKSTAEVSRCRSRGPVRFGRRVRLETGAGELVEFRIVGEDESDPSGGLISYVSPLAESLMGCSVGDRLPYRAARRKSSRSNRALGTCRGPSDVTYREWCDASICCNHSPPDWPSSEGLFFGEPFSRSSPCRVARRFPAAG